MKLKISRIGKTMRIMVQCIAVIAFSATCSITNAQITTSGDFNISHDGSDPWLVGGDGNGDTFGDSSLRLEGHPNVTSMTIAGGSMVSNQSGTIASDSAGMASVTVTGAGSAWNNAFDLSIGTETGSTGALLIENGGSVSNGNATLGGIFNTNSIGSVEVDGAGSTWTNTGTVRIGNQGTGSLDITNGGSVTSANAILSSLSNPQASFTPSGAMVSIDGVGSSWDIAGDLDFGNFGSTPPGLVDLSLTNGGELTVGGILEIRSFGDFIVDGGVLNAETIDLTAANAFDNFDFQSGELNVDSVVGDLVQDGGILAPGDLLGVTEMDSNYTLNGGTIEIELGGLRRGTEFDAIDVAGTTVLNGVTIEVSFVNGFEASLFDSFDIFDGAIDPSSTFTFDFVNAPLDDFQFWDTDSFLNNGIISAVPEPSGVAILVLASAILATRKRRVC